MKNKKGFTLVEIMIVVVIIGLLAAMAIPAFNKVRSTSQEKAVTNNLRQIAAAADQYFLDAGKTTVAWTQLTQDYLRGNVASVAGEDYATTFANIDMNDTQLSINVPALNKNVSFDR